MTIAHWHGVSEYSIRTVFTTSIMFLFHHFKDHRYIKFPERQEFKHALPKLFRTFKNIRASVDCTGFKCEMPQNYSQQGNCYSSYKSHCTVPTRIALMNQTIHLNTVNRIVCAWTITSLKSRYLPGFLKPGYAKKNHKRQYSLIHIVLS